MFHGFRLALKPIVQYLSKIVNNVSPTRLKNRINYVTIRKSTFSRQRHVYTSRNLLKKLTVGK